jgi:hypothetical protein
VASSQTSPLAHGVLHPPQWCESLFTSMQSCPQSDKPLPHTIAHAPCEQTWSLGHALLHAPQFRWSLCKSLHVPSHTTSVPGPHGLWPPSGLCSVALLHARRTAAIAMRALTRTE